MRFVMLAGIGVGAAGCVAAEAQTSPVMEYGVVQLCGRGGWTGIQVGVGGNDQRPATAPTVSMQIETKATPMLKDADDPAAEGFPNVSSALSRAAESGWRVVEGMGGAQCKRYLVERRR